MRLYYRISYTSTNVRWNNGKRNAIRKIFRVRRRKKKHVVLILFENEVCKRRAERKFVPFIFLLYICSFVAPHSVVQISYMRFHDYVYFSLRIFSVNVRNLFQNFIKQSIWFWRKFTCISWVFVFLELFFISFYGIYKYQYIFFENLYWILNIQKYFAIRTRKFIKLVSISYTFCVWISELFASNFRKYFEH